MRLITFIIIYVYTIQNISIRGISYKAVVDIFTLRPMATSNITKAGHKTTPAPLTVSDEAISELKEIKAVIKRKDFQRLLQVLLKTPSSPRPGHFYRLAKRIKTDLQIGIVEDPQVNKKMEDLFTMVFKPEWFWRAVGCIFISGKPYIIKSRHGIGKGVTFGDLVVTKCLETNERISEDLVSFLNQRGIKTPLKFEPGMILVSKNRKNRYKIREFANGHSITLDENGKLLSVQTGYFDLKDTGRSIPILETLKNLLKDKSLILLTHLHLGDNRLYLTKNDIKYTILDGRFASQLIVGENGKGRIYVPRQAEPVMNIISILVGYIGPDTARIMEALRYFYLIEDVDFSFLLNDRKFREKGWRSKMLRHAAGDVRNSDSGRQDYSKHLLKQNLAQMAIESAG